MVTVTVSLNQLTRDELMHVMQANAENFRPRLFAIYGVAKRINEFLPECPFVVWGMDFGDERGAVAWDVEDRSSHSADSAARVLRFYERLGDARLVWLDPEE